MWDLQKAQNGCFWLFWGYQKWHFGCPNQNSKTTFQYKHNTNIFLVIFPLKFPWVQQGCGGTGWTNFFVISLFLPSITHNLAMLWTVTGVPDNFLIFWAALVSQSWSTKWLTRWSAWWHSVPYLFCQSEYWSAVAEGSLSDYHSSSEQWYLCSEKVFELVVGNSSHLKVDKKGDNRQLNYSEII